MASICWSDKTSPLEIQRALMQLAVDYPIVCGAGDGVCVRFVCIAHETDGQSYRIDRCGDDVVVYYSSVASAMRAVGAILADANTLDESTPFVSLGIMLSCSQNAVMTVEHVKKWLRKLVLMGYNRILLDTDDIYQLSDEPYFGYMRGPYGSDELREIDVYAQALGVEMLPCIQTLGHLGTVLRWDGYQHIRDTKEIMLVGEERTYQLIDKMLQFWSVTCSTQRIHLGMDEAHQMGTGRYLDMHGYRPRAELFAEHLDRVCRMCREYGLQPMIWSDMFFRNASQARSYYDKEIVFGDADRQSVPDNLELVYWDYYHDDEAFYAEWIDRHRQLGREPIMAGGVWTWRTLWYNRKLTELTMTPCIDACRRKGVRELFFTLWGDDGAYCDFDSAMIGLTWASQRAWTGKADDAVTRRRFSSICGADYDECSIACELTDDATIHEKEIWGKELLWDDPILGILWRQVKLQNPQLWTSWLERYESMAARLDRCTTRTTAGGDLNYARAMTRFFIEKIRVKLAIDNAYAKRDRNVLRAISAKDIPALLRCIDDFDAAFRTQWLRRNKHYGLEAMQIRIAGQRRRWQECAVMLLEFADGRCDALTDFSADLYEPLPYYPKTYQFLATSALQL